MDDKNFMKKTIALAAKAKGRTSPNPMVGALIVKNGRVISADYHRQAGMPHAEALALKKAGKKAVGAVLYINLEPCCHTDKRTPPCTKAIINTGIKKVVIAMRDPNPKVNAGGIKELINAGIETEVGIMEEEAKRLNEAYIKFITKKEPFVILKAGQSIDGKIATSTGESKWITSEDARRHVHRLRSEMDAVLVGIGTVLKDNPLLTSRIKGGRDPQRIIVDSKLQIPLTAKLLKHKDGKTIIATTNNADKEKIRQLKNYGVQILKVKNKNRMVDLKALMKELGRLHIMSVLIEGGSSINASALSSGIVDKILFFVAPKIIGGVDSITSIGGRSPVSLKGSVKVKGLKARKIGENILLEGYLAHS
ncbi:MAG: bifunctional diaminohydroxyphosphoribosylaminopyrimidine deaminase/5-amino-6-(5-phosphoribosylamino)uracil reductase RibD [Nitrospirae bacterium]|nr:bifunctional diaminohydroxyphosphoribosylaminopyrimidine deaminase/5-amino-6-(5-phosphoribosylamino)uracil reductase RibD [Nitrospirota bacterium]